VARLEFPVRMTTEIDGTVYLLEGGVERGIGDLKLELLNDQQQTVAEATSSWDGFYIVTGVVAGDYRLRISPQQLQRLGLTDTTGSRQLSVSGDDAFISGMDMIIRPSSGPQPIRPAPRNPQGTAQPRGQAQLRSESWIQGQPATNFTIQLMAASSEAAVQGYIERHDLTDTATYFRSQRHGSPWFSVVYGSFTSDRQARAALKQLPPALATASPWLRQYADIQ
jgi:hypothetical protein